MPSKIIKTSTYYPQYTFQQADLIEGLKTVWTGKGVDLEKLEELNQNTGVHRRNIIRPKEYYYSKPSFEERNKLWLEGAIEFGVENLKQLFTDTVEPTELDFFLTNTISGLAVPSIEALLMNHFDLPSDLKRVPLFGLGCMGGAAGIARASELVNSGSSQAAIFMAIEMCSLNLQWENLDTPSMIGSLLFGDGSAGVLMLSENHPEYESFYGIEVIDSHSAFYPNTKDVMGWKFSGNGFGLILNSKVAFYAKNKVKAGLESFLEKHDLKIEDISNWIMHPGSLKLLGLIAEGLEIDVENFNDSVKFLKEHGNISSVSVLGILDQMIHDEGLKEGYGLMIAFGPGFSAEFVLLKS